MRYTADDAKQIRALFLGLQRCNTESVAQGRDVDIGAIEAMLTKALDSSNRRIVIRGLAEFVGSALAGSVLKYPTLKSKL